MLSFSDWPYINSSFNHLIVRNCCKEKEFHDIKIKQVSGKFFVSQSTHYFSPYCKVPPGFRARLWGDSGVPLASFFPQNLSIKKIFDQPARISLFLWGMERDKNKIHHRRMVSREVPSYTPLSHSQTHRIDLKAFHGHITGWGKIFFGLENI